MERKRRRVRLRKLIKHVSIFRAFAGDNAEWVHIDTHRLVKRKIRRCCSPGLGIGEAITRRRDSIGHDLTYYHFGLLRVMFQHVGKPASDVFNGMTARKRVCAKKVAQWWSPDSAAIRIGGNPLFHLTTSRAALYRHLIAINAVRAHRNRPEKQSGYCEQSSR